MTLRDILRPNATIETEEIGWAVSEKLYASLGSPCERFVLAEVLQRLINTLRRKHIRYPAIFLLRRAQLLGKASDGSTWEPGQIENQPIELPEQLPITTEEQIIARARATYSPEEFTRWMQVRGQTGEPQKSSVIEIGRKKYG